MNFIFDLHSFHQLPVHCNNLSSWLKAMIECWNFLNSKLWGLVRCRKKRISASRDRYLRWAMKISHALVQCNFTPSNLSYLSALTRRCRLFTSTKLSFYFSNGFLPFAEHTPSPSNNFMALEFHALCNFWAILVSYQPIVVY